MLHRRAHDQSRIDAYETRRRTAIDTINRENPLEIIDTPTNTPDRPGGAHGPGARNHRGDGDGENAVEQQPPASGKRPERERDDPFNDALRDQICDDRERKGREARHRVRERVDPDRRVQHSEDDLAE